jgi:GNAT superfamily N-acetyltransferase
MAALTGILPGALDQPAAELILRRIMFQKDAEQEYRGRNKRLKQRILHALEGYLGMNPETIVLRLLRRVPVVDRHRASWTSLDNVTVRQLLDTPLANEDHRGGFGFEGWAHAVVDLYQELETVYAKYGPAAETNHLAPDRELKLTRLQSEIESAVSSPLARIVCRDFLNETLKPHLGRSVADVLTHKVDDSGFYASFYSGPPEKVEADWAENYHIHTPGTIKRIAFREPFGDFQLSLFRLRRFFETEGPRLYEFEAVVHDRNDALIAKLGLALFIGEGDTSAEELAWCLDEHDHDDLREVALGLAQACYASRIDEELLDRVMVLRDWEVREDHRGRGLGKKLLNEAVRRSVRGLARPSVLACRLCPARFTIAPYSEWVDEAIRGVDSVVHRELAIPVAELQEIFRRCVGPGSYVAQKGVQSFDAPFLPWLHRNRHDLTLLAMTFARPPAKLRRK